MNKKQISNTMLYMFITTFVISFFAVSGDKMAFAFIGFFLGDDENNATTGEESTSSITSESSNLQNSRCYSPQGSIIDSCNSDGKTERENTGYNTLTQ